MKAQNVWQQAIDKINELKLLTLEDQDETTEYYTLLEELHAYDYCMGREFKQAFYDELDNILEFEKEWRASLEEEK